MPTVSKYEFRFDKKENALPESNITLSNGMEFVRVPAGSFIFGESSMEQSVHISYNYWIGRFLITNEQYFSYTYGQPHPVPHWEKKFDHPVVNIHCLDAASFCQRLNDEFYRELPSELVFRLPSELEWEKAARGTDGRVFPWGNVFDKQKCNTAERSEGCTTPVGLYSPQGDSPYGCADMAGNVLEWMNHLQKRWPVESKVIYSDKNGSFPSVIRGGSFKLNYKVARCSSRHEYNFFNALDQLGFRVVIAHKDIQF